LVIFLLKFEKGKFEPCIARINLPGDGNYDSVRGNGIDALVSLYHVYFRSIALSAPAKPTSGHYRPRNRTFSTFTAISACESPVRNCCRRSPQTEENIFDSEKRMLSQL
jgi:hypothetical protein